MGSFAAGDIGRGYQPNLFADVIEGKHFVKEEQAGIGNSQLVGCQFGQSLNLAHRVIGEKAHRSGGEGWQAGQARGFVAGQGAAQHNKDIVFNLDYLIAFSDGDIAAASHDALEGGDADKGIAA